ncbi:MAG TPA: RNA-binding domain-containing protein [Candidatus Obscuribacterales bacterium]
MNIEEDVSLEVKEALGRDGKGEFPRSALESYSAMANTYGGVILLGIREKPKGVFHAVGLSNPSAVLKQMWDLLHSKQAVSINLLREDMASVVSLMRLFYTW